ncbi:MAG: Asp23/Gls24 family envelope stress response protein [Clostridia bacterium]|nr:Asp23/Gls24 family envelope stress response protein [Clostridia bacterium]
MRFKTKNGLVDISSDVFAKIAAYAAANCFGVRELCHASFADGLTAMAKKTPMRKGVQVFFEDGAVRIVLRISMVNGVNMQAVCRSIRSEVRYLVEKYTGVKVAGVRIYIEAVTAK